MKLFFPICVVAMATLGVAVPKFNFSQRHVILVLCAKFHDNRVKTAEVTGSRIFPQKMLLPWHDDSAHTKNDWRLRFTIMHLHAKFEDDPRRTAAGRVLTIKSQNLCGGGATRPKP